MKHLERILGAAIIAGCLIPACTYDQIMATGNVVQPLINAALNSTAAYYGLPPESSVVINAASASLWGAAAKKWGQQPAQTGAVSPSVGKAIVAALPAVSGSQQAVLLQQAAAQVELRK